MKAIEKWFLLAVLAVTIICTPVASAKVQITYSYMGSPQEAAAYEQVIADFNRLHPDIEVIGRHVPDGYFDRLTMEIAGGIAPDVFHVWTEGYMRPFQQAGWLLDLNEYVENDEEFNLADFPPNLLEAAELDGGLYALPRDIALRVMFYNRDMYNEAGIPEPDAELTWGEARKNAIRLTTQDSDGRTVSLGLDWSWWWGSWMNMVWMWGGEITDPQVTRATLNTPEALEGLNFMMTAFNEGWMGGPHFNWGDGFGFETGKVAMKWDGHWAVPWARDAVRFDWDVAHVPKGPAGRTTLLGATWYGVYAYTEHPQEAAEFAKYLVTEGNRIYTRLGAVVPSRFSIMSSEDFLCPDLPPKNRHVWMEAAPTGKWPPLTDRWSQLVDEMMSPELEKAFRGECSIEQAVDQIQRMAPSILQP
ncbi:MAG: sugar ABC transporter substrate-binding protein [Limnochordia bacterium]|nr:sugar ABC transporter substrate-binding protein [Limnochordia bacterium]